MRGRDITKMAGWAKLAALGFTPILFRGQMGYYEIGAALQVPFGPCLDGKMHKADRVTVEPSHYFTNPKGKRVGHWTVSAVGDGGLTWTEGRGVIKAATEAAARAAAR